MEALEFDTSLLLIDEDTSAANLITRDARMQALVPKEEEPATPLIDILPVIRDELNVSSVLIGSGTGDYFDCADTVIAMKNFRPITVPQDSYFVLGDNRDNSRDSRSFGFVHRKLIVGQAKGIITSFDITDKYLPRFKRFFDSLK